VRLSVLLQAGGPFAVAARCEAFGKAYANSQLPEGCVEVVELLTLGHRDRRVVIRALRDHAAVVFEVPSGSAGQRVQLAVVESCDTGLLERLSGHRPTLAAGPVEIVTEACRL
jgi:hypothetical protein